MSHFLWDNIPRLADGIFQDKKFKDIPSSMVEYHGVGKIVPPKEAPRYTVKLHDSRMVLVERYSKPIELATALVQQGYGTTLSNTSSKPGEYDHTIFTAFLSEFPACCGIAILSNFNRAIRVGNHLPLLLEYYLHVISSFVRMSNYTYTLMVTTPDFDYLHKIISGPAFKGNYSLISSDVSSRTGHLLRLERLNASPFTPTK